MLDGIHRALLSQRIIWSAFLLTPFMFAAMLFIVDLPAEPDPFLPMMLALVAMLQIPAMFFIRFKMLGSLGIVAPDDLRIDERVEESALTDAIRVAAGKYNTAQIVSYSLAESVMIMGWTGSFLSGSPGWFAGCAMSSLALLLVMRPTESGLMCALSGPERQTLRAVLEQRR